MSQPQLSTDRTLGQALLLGFGLSWLIVLVMLILTLVAMIIGGYFWLTPRIAAFTKASQTTVSEALVTGYVGWTTAPEQTNERTTILVLGLDSLATRGDAPALTDTMMLITVNHSNGQIKTVSLPRDTWSETYSTRLNALYFYGQERDPAHPEDFPTQVLSELTGIPIHHTIVISLEQLAELIDLVGGVNVNVTEGFIDPLFPRTDVDVTVERDPAKLYETIEFVAGEQHMTGERALKFIRSRKSQGDTGTDTARTGRQQQVIEALLSTMTKSTTLRNPELVGRLYHYYQTTFAKYLPMTEAVGIARSLYPQREHITFSGQALSFFPEDPAGVLFHPDPKLYNGQWLYVIPNLDQFRTEIKQKLDVH